MQNQNGLLEFEEWSPQGGGGGGKYKAYANQCVVIVHRANAKSKKSGAKLILPEFVLKKLGNPDFVGVATRGNNTFIMRKAEQDEKKYSVQHHKAIKKFAYVSCYSYIEAYGIPAGVYNAVFDSGMIVFDRLQHPSQIK